MPRGRPNRGLELEGKWLVLDSGTLNFAVGLLNAKYKSFVFPVVTNCPLAIDFAGTKLDEAPSSSISLGYTHNCLLADGGGSTVYAGTPRSAACASRNFVIAAPVQYEQKAFDRSDVNLSCTAPRDNCSVQLYRRSLEANNVTTGLTFSTFTGTQVLLAEPRMFGVCAGVKFWAVARLLPPFKAAMKLKFSQKLAYGLGDDARNVIFASVSAFSMCHHIDIDGLPAVVGGTILFVARFVRAL